MSYRPKAFHTSLVAPFLRTRHSSTDRHEASTDGHPALPKKAAVRFEDTLSETTQNPTVAPELHTAAAPLGYCAVKDA